MEKCINWIKSTHTPQQNDLHSWIEHLFANVAACFKGFIFMTRSNQQKPNMSADCPSKRDPQRQE